MSASSFAEKVLQIGLAPQEARKQLSSEPKKLRHAGDIAPAEVFRGVRHKVGLLFTSRSGTTFFVDVLNRTGELGHIREHMNGYMQKTGATKWRAKSMSDYVAKSVQRHTTDNGVYGFKGTAEALLPLIQIGELPDNAAEWSWITVRREDIVSQAISLYRAKSTGVWHNRGRRSSSEKPPMPPYDFAAIEKQVNLIQRRQGQIERFISHHGLQPLRLVYEEFRDDPTDALHAVFEHVGLPAPARLRQLATETEFKVLRNAESERYAHQFRVDLEKSFDDL